MQTTTAVATTTPKPLTRNPDPWAYIVSEAKAITRLDIMTPITAMVAETPTNRSPGPRVSINVTFTPENYQKLNIVDKAILWVLVETGIYYMNPSSVYGDIKDNCYNMIDRRYAGFTDQAYRQLASAAGSGPDVSRIARCHRRGFFQKLADKGQIAEVCVGNWPQNATIDDAYRAFDDGRSCVFYEIFQQDNKNKPPQFRNFRIVSMSPEAADSAFRAQIKAHAKGRSFQIAGQDVTLSLGQFSKWQPDPQTLPRFRTKKP